MHSLPLNLLSISSLTSGSQSTINRLHHPKCGSFINHSNGAVSGSVFIQRLSSLRTDLEDAAHLVDEGLILESLTALQILDIVRWCVRLLRQLCLCHLVWVLGSSVSDSIAKGGGSLLWYDDLVGAVDVGQMRTLDAFLDLDGRSQRASTRVLGKNFALPGYRWRTSCLLQRRHLSFVQRSGRFWT